MKIVFLTRSLGYGGAERQLVALAGGLKERGHDVAVLCFYPETPLGGDLEARGVEVTIVGKRGRWDWFRFAYRFVRSIRARRPDVLHSYLPVPNVVAAMCRPFFRSTRLVWGIRAADVDLSKFDWLTRASYRVERFFSRAADLIIVNSEAGLQHCAQQGFPRERMIVIPNGVDVDRFHPDAEGRHRVRKRWNVAADVPMIGMIARVDPLKDHETFLRAAANVAAARPDARFVCIGEGPRSRIDKLKTLAGNLGLRDRLIWDGATDDVRAVYNALDVVCLSSYTEGFPNVLGEAMACGTPCVATDAGDSRLIVDGAGLVVPSRAPQQLGEALLTMLDQLATYQHVVRPRIVENFSVGNLIGRTEAALRAALGRS